MSSLLDFVPLFQETLANIRARLDADVNAGRDPGDPNFIDTTEGGFYWDLTQAVALEIERLWDAVATEYPAAAFPAFAWADFLDEHAEALGLARKVAVKATGSVTFSGTNGTLVSSGTQVQTAPTSPDLDPIAFQATGSGTIASGTVILPVEAVEPGADGNVSANSVTVLATPVAGITSVTNAAGMTGGADVESDEQLRARVLLELGAPQGAGNVADYQRWGLAYPGVGFVTVQPLWAGAGTVRVMVTDATNRPVSGTIVSGLQAQLDPVAGQGLGLAPVGATVTVATPTTLTVNVAATVSFQTGYTLTGTGGTIATTTDIQAAVSSYINGLQVGDDVVLNHVIAQFFRVTGVLNVSSVLLNGAGTDAVVSGTQVATAGTYTLV